MNRRSFLQQGASGAGWLMLAGVPLETPGAEVNRFAYDVERFKKTDPKVIGYELVTRFPSPVGMPRCVAVPLEDRLAIAGKDGVVIADAEGGRVATMDLPAPVRCVATDGERIYAGLRDHVRV